MDGTEPVNPFVQQWQKALTNAFKRRIDAAHLAPPLQELARRYPASSREVTDVLLDFRGGSAGFNDPLLFQYARLLLRSNHIDACDLLVGLLQRTPFFKETENGDSLQSKSGLPSCEERMLTTLAQMSLSGGLTTTSRKTHNFVYALTRWLDVVEKYETMKQLESGALHTIDALSYGIYEALASLTLAAFGNHSFRKVADQAWWKKRKPTVTSIMENFDLEVLQWMQSPLSGRLRALAAMPPFIETDENGRPVFTAQQVLEAVTDLPVTHSRAGLYVWLNACLCARPLTDDMSMLTYLQVRFSGDNQSLVVGLLIACFDVLTNAMLCKEPRQQVKIIRSFISNKVPLLLAMLAGFIAPMTAEGYIPMAFMSIPMNPVEPLSAGSNDVQEMLKLTRLEFLQACALHGLVSEGTIGAIIHEPIALPRVTRMTREVLVAQCINNVGRLETLIDDLESMQGNAGAIAGCIVDVVNNLCAARDTMSLKTACNLLIRKVPNLDIVMQYSQPNQLLLPVCTLLDHWTHDQEQMEFTPSYEEFAAILLFVLAISHRYDLSAADIGLPSTETFLTKLLGNVAESIPLPDLTEEQSKQLSRWVDGFYSTDEQGDTSGIGDEVMRQCPPHAFYLLVPTLLEQSVLACRSGGLSIKTFKGGLELLLEPFLIPSLVGGLGWLINHSMEDHGDADVLLQVLDKLLKPSSTSQETQAMHRAILAIVARPLNRTLQNLAKKQPERKEPQALIELIKPHTDRQRSLNCSRLQFDEAVKAGDNRVGHFLRNIVSDLTTWSTSAEQGPPTQYSHSMLDAGNQILGPSGVLALLASELRISPQASTTLDICVSMVCAPSPSSEHQTLLALGSSHSNYHALDRRDVLRLMLSNTQELLDLPFRDAEALIRIGRRVEVQTAPVHIPQIPLAVPQVSDEAADQLMADLGLTGGDNGASAPPVETSQVTDLLQSSDTAVDVDFAAALDQPVNLSGDSVQDIGMNHPDDFLEDMVLNIPAGQQQRGNLGSSQPNPDEDIFADLDMLGEDFTFS